MPSTRIADWTLADYERAAQEYLRKLPPEHFMEAMDQGRQRKITLACLDMVSADWPAFQALNEILIQYPINDHLGQVCPDNTVVVTAELLRSLTSFNLPFEGVKPVWVLEYVSPSSKRKDYVDNLQKYEQELQVPYYLLFYPEKQDLRLYHHNGMNYDQVTPNESGRLALPELDVEVALLDGWVRYWYQGRLLPLTAELRQEAREQRVRAEVAERQAQLERARAEQEKQRAEQEKQRAETAEREVQRLLALVAQLQSLQGPS